MTIEEEGGRAEKGRVGRAGTGTGRTCDFRERGVECARRRRVGRRRYPHPSSFRVPDVRRGGEKEKEAANQSRNYARGSGETARTGGHVAASFSPERGVERVDPSIVGLKTRSRVIRETGVYECAFFRLSHQKATTPSVVAPRSDGPLLDGSSPLPMPSFASQSRDARPQCADSHWCSSPRPRAPPPPARARLGAPSRPTRRLASSAPPRASRPPARVLSRGPGAFADPRGPSRALPPAAASPASLTAPRSRHGVVRARRRPRRAALPGAARRTPPRGSLARPPPRPPALSPRRRRASRARRLGRGTLLRRGGG